MSYNLVDPTTGDLTRVAGNAANADLKDLNVYSTEEKIVGTWIDGKPIYRRYLTFQLPEDASYPEGETERRNVLNFMQEDIDTFIDAHGAINLLDDYVVPVPYNYGSHVNGVQQNNCWYFNRRTKNVTISLWTTSSSYNNASGYLFIYFTKTTD